MGLSYIKNLRFRPILYLLVIKRLRNSIGPVVTAAAFC